MTLSGAGIGGWFPIQCMFTATESAQLPEITPEEAGTVGNLN